MREYDNNFNSIDDFRECMSRGCEVEFIYNNKNYSITQQNHKIMVCEMYNASSEKQYSNPHAALEYEIDDKKLRDVLQEIKIVFRTF